MRVRSARPGGRPPAATAGRSAAAVLPILLLATATTCRDPSGPALSGGTGLIAVAFGTEPSDYHLDPWELVEGAVEEDTLRLDVRYSGGCVEHDFTLAAVEDWIDLPTFGPTPSTAVPVLLAHDGHDDACDAIIGVTLRFGLEPLRDAYRQQYGSGPGRIVLRLIDGRSDVPVDIYDWFLS
jgi:hypothetical protein